MELYTVLFIDIDTTRDSCIRGIFKNFNDAKSYILKEIKPLIEDYSVSWYRNNGTKRLEGYENDLDRYWETKPFNIYKIEKHSLNLFL